MARCCLTEARENRVSHIRSIIAAGCRWVLTKSSARLGAGGMGEVFKAHDPRLNRFVAIKFLKPAHAHRFVWEAQAASALNHPNIITIHDVGNDGSRDYLVMEYVAGKTLDGADSARRHAPWRVAEIRDSNRRWA